MDKDINLKPGQVAARLRCSTRKLARLRSKGEGPPWFKFGDTVLYPRQGVEQHEQALVASFCPETCENHK